MGRYVVPRDNGDPACWRPAWGGVRLCGNGWWGRVIFGGRCRYDEVICSEMTRWGAGARYQICSVQMLAPLARPHPALRTTFPLEGEGSFGGAWLYVIPLNNGDPAPPPAFEPSEAKGKILRHHPNPRLEPPLGKVPRTPKLHRKGHPKRST